MSREEQAALTRVGWIAAFIGYVATQKPNASQRQVFDVADTLYPHLGHYDATYVAMSELDDLRLEDRPPDPRR